MSYSATADFDTIKKNLEHIRLGLRNGQNPTRANYAFLALVEQLTALGIEVPVDVAYTPFTSEADVVWEYGTAYDVDSITTIYTPTHSREHAEKQVTESPTDTGLVRRRAAGPWEQV